LRRPDRARLRSFFFFFAFGLNRFPLFALAIPVRLPFARKEKKLLSPPNFSPWLLIKRIPGLSPLLAIARPCDPPFSSLSPPPSVE